MRYPLYNQIKEILKTIIEAFEYIQENSETDIALQLLNDGNDAMNHIGQKIIENEDSIKSREVFKLTTTLLESIPNTLHKVKYMSDYKDINFIVETAKELLYEVDANINYKFELVFFAELGQKWDAMSSLYEAYKKREDCHVTVVITPIFRRIHNQDGTVMEEMIYEDYLTELEIEHTPYEQYDISTHLPDMAFISNPYESVTLPQFWPENISKYTRLVYVPYYTAVTLDSPTNHTEFKLPFTYYSWKILVQSEEMKNMYKKYTVNKGENVVVTELPKWDEIYKVEGLVNLDPKFKKLEGKKVFLWNAHFSVGSPTSTFLEYSNKIIEMFQEREDVALIFRPHPMMQTIFNLYATAHKSQWNTIIDAIKHADNMLFDNAPSYKHSFAYADALLSDYSSLIGEFALLEKPVLWLKNAATDKYFENIQYTEFLDDTTEAYDAKQIEAFIDSVRDNLEVQVNHKLPALKGDIGDKLSKKLLRLLEDELQKG